MNGLNLANGSQETKRRELDFYPTPPEATRALIQHLAIPTNQTIWEPACGDGAMSRVFESCGYKVFSSDVFARGFGTRCDFLEPTEMRFDWIVTNPPFNLSGDFIELANERSNVGCALLLKSQFWHAKKRTQLFRKYPPSHVLALTWRPDFRAGELGGSPTMECLWTVWVKGKTETRYDLLEKP